MVLQASSGHELVDEKALLIFEAVTYELYEIGVRQLAQVIHFSLQCICKAKRSGGSVINK
jgi:hypothetical protein